MNSTATATKKVAVTPPYVIPASAEVVITPPKFVPGTETFDGVTLELSADAAEVLFGIIGGLHCRPIEGDPEYNWDLFLALKNAGVPKGAKYDAAYRFIKRVARAVSNPQVKA